MWKNIKINGHNLTKKYWKTYTIILTLPTIWFSLVLNYFGIYFKLQSVEKNGNKALTPLGLVLTVLVISLVLIVNATNNYFASKSESNKLMLLSNENIFYQQLNESVDNICDEKLIKLKAVMHQTLNDKRHSIPTIISDPSKQLRKILEQINTCLCLFISQPLNKFRTKDFNITLIYNLPKDGETWYWLEGTNERDFSLDDLINPKNNTSFNYVRNNKLQYYFNNRKEDAKDNGHYVYDSQDETNAKNKNEVGSIFCYKFQIKTNNTVYVNAIISISTYQKRFVPDNNEEKINNTRENIVKLVKENFGKRIQIELCLLYLEKQKSIEKNSELEEPA
jgi:hypothetical protein